MNRDLLGLYSDCLLNAPHKTVERSVSRSGRIPARGTLGGCRLASRSVPSADGGSVTQASAPPPTGVGPATSLHQIDLAQSVLHHAGGSASHTRQDVTVRVQGESYAGVPQE